MPINTLKRLRIEKDWTQLEAAAVIGIGIDTLKKLEGGKRKAQEETLYKLAKAYNADFDQLAEEFLDRGAEERGRLGGWYTQKRNSGGQLDVAPSTSLSAPSEAGSADKPAPLAP